MIINGVKCNTIEEVELQIIGLSEEQKQVIRNDFNGIPNAQSTVVPSVTPRQMRIALVLSGISISSIESIIDSLPEPDKSITKITWEYSTAFERTNPVLNAMAPMIGMTSSQLDSLFNLAATL